MGLHSIQRDVSTFERGATEALRKIGEFRVLRRWFGAKVIGPWVIILVLLAQVDVARAQVLPDNVRAAGITVAEWQAVQEQIRSSAAARGASEQSLTAVARRLSVNLAVNGRVDLNDLLRAIDERAQQIVELQSELARVNRSDEPAVTLLLSRARELTQRSLIPAHQFAIGSTRPKWRPCRNKPSRASRATCITVNA